MIITKENALKYKLDNEDVIQIHYSNPIALTLLKPAYRKIGNTIGRIPTVFLI